MPWLIGLDEAGYGPNLGPLVIAVTVWEIPGDPSRRDLYDDFHEIVAPAGAADTSRLLIADSKQVYSSKGGLALLEQGVLTGLALQQALAGDASPDPHIDRGQKSRSRAPTSYRQLMAVLATTELKLDDEPWFRGADLMLPTEPPGDAGSWTDGWITCCRRLGLRLALIGVDFVSPSRFNAMNRQTGSKGRSLSELTLRLLNAVLPEQTASRDRQMLVIADKHGGRNRYHEFLPLAFGDAFIVCLEERAQRSRYRVGSAEIRFETRAESHLPVALASMTAKYVRELSMRLFNEFWAREVPGIRPTAGYPVDAARFRGEIALRQQQLRIPDDLLWRER